MKNNLKKQLVAMLFLLAIGSPALGQYEITWHTVDAGGGTSSGGGYEVRGTAGQPDASVVTHAADLGGGDYYALGGGYWANFNICVVDLVDLEEFAVFWLDSGAGIPADFDSSGNVDIYDFSELNLYWLSLCPANWPL